MKKRAAFLLILATTFVLSLPPDASSKPRVIHVEWDYQFDGNVAGFRLYQDGKPVCETKEPNATAMDCSVNLPDGEYFFTLTTFFIDGSESLPSAPFSYIFSSKLLAAMTAQPLEGENPLAVTFDASSSAGDIIRYEWAFGDGETGTGDRINHTFFSAGNYTAILKVIDDIGAVDRESVSILVTSPTAVNIPPMAVISSSLSVGDAPLPVQFDGSGSTDSDGAILAYAWDLGDGNTATGALTENTYITAGTFNAALTVTDTGGLMDSTSTPVLVSDPSDSSNISPVAAFSASTNLGTAPLAVTFDAGESYDPDGEINSYSWSFGDGTVGSGAMIDHIFIQPGEYTIRLKITDNSGAVAEAVYMVTVQSGPLDISVPIELGRIRITSSWSRVDLTRKFINPVVIVSPLSSIDSEPCIVRIRNVDPAGFDIRIQEWDYLDGAHAYETVHYIVVEQGSYTLENGARVEAGSFVGGIRFQPLEFQNPFPAEPAVFTTVSTFNEEDAVSGRIRKLSSTGFEYKLSEQEANKFDHADELIGYIAFEIGTGNMGPLVYDVGKTDDSVTNLPHQISFQEVFTVEPYFFAEMLSYDSAENSTVRYQNLTPADVSIFIEEEASKDGEIDHTTETVGYMAFSAD